MGLSRSRGQDANDLMHTGRTGPSPGLREDHKGSISRLPAFDLAILSKASPTPQGIRKRLAILGWHVCGILPQESHGLPSNRPGFL